MGSIYPQNSAERTRWILARRGPRQSVDPLKPYAFCLEDERTDAGEITSVATLFLTNRECPWRCLMCDLWRHTLKEKVPAGAIPEQIHYALAQLGLTQNSGRVTQIKLYNSGSFFDAQAIPPEDFPDIAARLQSFERVIVECHPWLVGSACLRFRDLLKGKLEVAMGLETVNEGILDRLNKRMTLAQFATAAEFLSQNQIALRAFILVKPPFLDEAEGLVWAKRSIDFAFDCGASVASLIPTRPGNGALEELAAAKEFVPPRLETLEAALSYGILLQRGRVFADLWDLEQFANCRDCFPARRERLREMNLRQEALPAIQCASVNHVEQRL